MKKGGFDQDAKKQAARIAGKGWTVSMSARKSTKYLGCAVRNGVRVVDGTPAPRWQTKEEAVRYAIAHAHKAGTLDWQKTARWLKLMGIQADIDGLYFPRVFKHAKGWYLSTMEHGRYHQIRVGCSHAKSFYWCMGATPYTVLKKAVAMGLMDEPCFDYESSIIWLKRKGLQDCIDLFERQKARKAAKNTGVVARLPQS